MYGVDTYFNKRSIQNRMKKLAVSKQGLKDASSLDPFLSLFLGSLSEEIYKIIGDIDKMEERILKKLSDMLISDTLLHPTPSSGILHVTPLDSVCRITKESSFNFVKSLSYNDDCLTFHPVCNTRIVQGDVRHIVINGLFYSVDSDQTKSLLSRPQENDQWKSFWIGIELDESVKNLGELSFYLNFCDIDAKDEYLNQLRYFKWKFKSHSLILRHGLSVERDEEESPEIGLFNTLDADYQICESVLSKYENNYFTVEDDITLSDKDRVCFPQELSSYFTDSFISSCTQPLIWIEIEYPDTIKEEILSSLQVSINTFPVVNKSLRSVIVNIDRFNPVISLETKVNEHFLSILSVTDEIGHKYHELPFIDGNAHKYKTYSLRRGGYEKYNSRDAREYLVNIYDFLDKYAISLNGDDTQADEELDGIQYCISELLQYLKYIIETKIETNDSQTYLQIDKVGSEKVLFIKYWITNTTKANNLKPGIILNNNSDLLLIPSSLALLNRTSDGKNVPLSDNRKNIYKQSLQKSILIITNEDIEQFCKEEFGAMLKSIRIKKGLTIDTCYPDRFMHTTDVYLTLYNEFKALLKENDKEIFMQKIQKKSPSTYRYRVYLN